MHDIQEGQILVDVNDDKKELNTNYEAELQAYKENEKRLPELSKKLKEAETNKTKKKLLNLEKKYSESRLQSLLLNTSSRRFLSRWMYQK